MSIIERALSRLQSQPNARERARHAIQASPRPAPRAVAPALPGAEAPAPRPPDLHVDLTRLRELGAIPAESHAARTTDEYRRIKWPLLARAFGRGGEPVALGSILQVTSALPGDGKTFTSLNLALNLALEHDSSVLLIDADVAKSHLTEIFGLRDAPGLTDALLDESRHPDEFTLTTDIPGLSVLPAGRRIERLPELLGSQRMETFVAGLAAAHPERFHIFDSSPLLAASDSVSLSRVVGQILVVIGANHTPVPAVDQALAMLDDTRPVSLLLNQVRYLFAQSAYYGGNYYYGNPPEQKG